MFKHNLNRILNQKLPPFERPRCQAKGCTAALGEPRPFFVEPQGAPGVLTHHCLAQCPACGAQYKGERHVGVSKAGVRAIDQSFHPYDEQDRQLVARFLPKYQQHAAEITKVQNRQN